MNRYKFDKEQLKFVKEKRGIKWWLWIGIRYFLVSVFLALAYYVVFAVFISTDKEKELALQAELMEQEYGKLQERIGVLDNTIKNLQQRDKEIYRSIFNSEPPAFSSVRDNYIFDGIDTTRIEAIIVGSEKRIDGLELQMERVEESIKGITDSLSVLAHGVTSIPSIIPIKDFTIRQSGASVGMKVNPFYKTVTMHSGMDLLAATGTSVVAAADGVVEKAVRKGKKEGSTIEINHKNGYITKYKHLGDILVRKGQKVKQGTVIGRVGVSGMSFAPHLHYEVWYNDEVMDPVNYYFSTLTPQMFKDMAVIVANTGQSLD